MSLTGSVALRLGPLMFMTALTHFLERHKESATRSKARDEILFDEAFTIVKAFMEAASRHTISELQEFANARVPAPPHIRSVRLLVPLSSCNEAAPYIIQALGGPEQASRIAGGIRWWQVRGLQGIDANWVVAKKDIEALRKANRQARSATTDSAKSGDSSPNGKEKASDGENSEEEGSYATEMDSMPCMYFLHGGGYYFGSVDQERYCMQRYARKMKGRVFGINYRLAPQYPFPCALQDALAGYLYLIQPPPGVHKPIHPSKIIFNGGSAGGGLVLALLQVLRDVGLPLPAGAVLVSPWTDLTHSFPSVFTNTATDIIPKYGLSLYRPSTLWPPPSENSTSELRNRFASRVKAVVLEKTGVASSAKSTISDGPPSPSVSIVDFSTPNGSQNQGTTSLGDTLIDSAGAQASSSHEAGQKLAPTLSHLQDKTGDVGVSDAPPPTSKEDTRTAPTSGTIPRDRLDPIRLQIDGKYAEINSQVQIYCMNNQLDHPLISPALGYLGGLCPLFIVASDKEVLRDEIIFIAHKASNPDAYPVKDEARGQQPLLDGIEKRHGPTDVHLQVYDETCHVLPMFSFATPAKYCYRAIAGFCRHVTKTRSDTEERTPKHAKTLPNPSVSPPTSPVSEIPRSMSVRRPPTAGLHPDSAENTLTRTPSARSSTSVMSDASSTAPASPGHLAPPWTRDGNPAVPTVLPEYDSKSEPGVAGNAFVYQPLQGCTTAFVDHIIRERVATNGVLRKLEPEPDLAGCTLPTEKLGVVSETGARRYLEGQALWDKKYKGAAKKAAHQREKHIAQAIKHNRQVLDRLQVKLSSVRALSKGKHFSEGRGEEEAKLEGSTPGGAVENDSDIRVTLNSPLWTWSWALDDEVPPPSSIVARGDTSQARELSKSADIRLDDEESRLSGNNLWAVVLNALTAASDKKPMAKTQAEHADDASPSPSISAGSKQKTRKRKSILSRLFSSTHDHASSA